MITLCVLAGMGLGAVDAVKTATLRPLRGIWEIVGAGERGGRVDPEEFGTFQVTVVGDRMTLPFEGRMTVTWAVTVRPDKSPKETDAVLRRPGEADKVIRGIYKFDQSTLTVAFGVADDPVRPKEYVSVGGATPTAVMVLKKLKSSLPGEPPHPGEHHRPDTGQRKRTRLR